MKNTFPLHSNPSRRPALGNRRGIALVSVLAVLILLTVLVVAFLMRAQVARTSSANYRATTGTRLLADTVLNLVQAEINDATTYGNGGSGGRYSWASQPGAIRVYDTSGGAATKIYRLYSAPSLTTSSISNLLDSSGNTTEIPNSWATDTAKYVDLNAPVSVTDPSNAANNFTIYPILDNRSPANTTQCVQLPGFFVNPIGTSTFPTTPTTTLNPPVMPVEWLYVLQNGQIVAPDASSSGGIATFTGSITPTGTNQIVGRIAYWTDDDTCKVNINTAAGSVSARTDAGGNNILVTDGGVFFKTTATVATGNAFPPAPWDTPRYMGGWDDVKLLAADQPLLGEYQRYPGHPATTILYYILRSLGISTTVGFTMPEVTDPINNGNTPYSTAYTTSGSIPWYGTGGCGVWPNTSSLFGLLPRYNDNGGSQGGLVDTTHSGASTTNSITTVRNRLYTSLGELLYSTSTTGSAPVNRIKNGTLNGNATPTPTSSLLFTRQQIETGKFFLTAHSRAPEVTLFGTPRVCMWPIGDPSGSPAANEGYTIGQTSFDNLIAYCSTTDLGSGGTPHTYYFKRYDRTSTVQTSTTPNISNDWNSETRNQALFTYLQDLTASDIPGYGGKFSTKYSASNYKTATNPIATERDQILTEIVDYIRCTNLDDHSGALTQSQNFCPDVRSPAMVMPLTVSASGGSGGGAASAMQGLGRNLTLSEIGQQIICTADGTNNLVGVNSSNANTGYDGSHNAGSSVAYNAPYNVSISGTTIPVSPVIGSASDPAYVSNLPTTQFLRDTSNNIVDVFGTTVTAANYTSCTKFPANPTLADAGNPLPTGGAYGDALSALPIGSKMMQAILVFELAAPMLGFDQMLNGSWGPSVNIHVTNIQNIPFSASTGSQFPTTSGNLTTINPFPNRTNTLASGSAGYAGPNVNGNGYLNGSSAGTSVIEWNRIGFWTGVGGNMGFRYPMYSQTKVGYGGCSRTNGWSGNGGLISQSGSFTTDTLGTSTSNCFVPNSANSTTSTIGTPVNKVTEPYRFVSNPFVVSTTSPATASTSPPSLSLGGSGTFTVTLEMPVAKSSGAVGTSTPYQTYSVGFPASPSLSPTLCAYGLSYNTGGASPAIKTTHAPDWWGFDNRIGWVAGSVNPYGITTTTPNIGEACVIRGDNAPASAWGTTTNPWSWKNTTAVITAAAGATTNTTLGDAFRSIVPIDGDYRMTMAKSFVNAAIGSANCDFMKTPLYDNAQNITSMLGVVSGAEFTPGTDVRGTFLTLGGSTTLYGPVLSPKVPISFTSGTPNPQKTFDWDSGMYSMPDGAYANKPDEGNNYVGNGVPYVNLGNQASNSFTSYFTANRIVNSPVMFGSLPTGVAEDIPWRTLLFRPHLKTSSGGTLPDAYVPSGPKDYLLLDNFWMPVVQPYAISEPFSTAGKINMNYQILPFTHIIRSTGVQAVLGSELVARVPSVDAGLSTSGGNAGNPQPLYMSGGANVGESTTQSGLYGAVNPSHGIVPARLPLNLSEANGSLRQFRARFASGDLFRSPAEICDIYLVPRDSMHTGNYVGWTSDALADAGWYGDDFGLVGDNVREHPYGDIYPRLTTKSNTYTVYYKVQVLKNPPTANQGQWNDATGVVTGEYRGSTSLERYLDPNNINIPDYALGANNPAYTSSAPNLDTYYQWRTLANNAFAP